MIVVATLRELRGRSRSVLMGALVGLVVAVLLLYSVAPGVPPAFESRQYEAGTAAAEVLVDSPTSQVVDLGGGDAEEPGQATDLAGLGTRAHLLAALMARSPLREQIAAKAGIAPDRFAVVAPTGDDPVPEEPGSEQALAADRDITVIDLLVDETLPIIAVNVRAPDAATAGRAAGAAFEELRAYVEKAADGGGVVASNRLALTRVSETAPATVQLGPRRLYAFVAFLLVLGLWCATILLRPRIVETWREVTLADAAAAAAPPAPDGLPADPDDARAEPAGAGAHARL